jgi:hypothetical protein
MSKPIDLMFDGVAWAKLPVSGKNTDDLPHATHEGILRVGDIDIHVYQLSDGRRVIDAAEVERFFQEG